MNHQIMTEIPGKGFLCVATVPTSYLPDSGQIAEDIARAMSHRGASHIITDGQVSGRFLNGQRDTSVPCVRYGCAAAEGALVHAPDGGHPYASAERQPGAEYVAGDRDWPECLCGNDPANSGFAPCLPDGTITTPLAAGPWDGIHIVCLQCGRIIDQDTLRITGHHANPDAMAAEAEAADAEEMAAGNG